MSLLAFLIIGFFVSLAARTLMPGFHPLGLVATTGLGVAGAFLGGLASSNIYPEQTWRELHAPGLVFSLAGAMLVLGLVSLSGRGRGLRM